MSESDYLTAEDYITLGFQTPGSGGILATRIEAVVARHVAEAERERDALARWKDESMPVLDGLQELGRALGLPLGARITGPEAAEAALAVRARAERAEAALADLRSRVGALADELPGGLSSNGARKWLRALLDEQTGATE